MDELEHQCQKQEASSGDKAIDEADIVQGLAILVVQSDVGEHGLESAEVIKRQAFVKATVRPPKVLDHQGAIFQHVEHGVALKEEPFRLLQAFPCDMVIISRATHGVG